MVEQIANWIWGLPLITLIVGGSIFLTIRTGFFQFKYFPFIIKETFGKLFNSDDDGKGTVSAFQAMTTALASSIGAANIVVAPTVIFTAGPGAIFWMWVSGIFSAATKFSEVALAVKYREKNEDGEFVGGASYTFKNALKGNLGKVFAFMVSFFFMIQILPSITIQTLSASGPMVNVADIVSVDQRTTEIVVILFIFAITALVAYGGVTAIGRLTEKLVPFMAALYILLGLVIIFMNLENLPGAFQYIFVGAFNPRAVAGGFAGATLRNVISSGVARGVYSNEAGMGSAGYGHAAATTDHPARQGIWGVFEVLIDTLVVCTISSLIILVTETWTPEMSENALSSVAQVAVERSVYDTLGPIGSIIISTCLFLFVLSTIIVIVFYCEKQAEYLFGTIGAHIFRALALCMILISLFTTFGSAGAYLDIALALVVIPNMIGLLLLNKDIKNIVDDFFKSSKYLN